jgi:membrane protein
MLESLIEAAGRVPVLGPVVRAVLRAFHADAMDLAASMAYFSFLSLFPLLLAVISIGSLFLDPGDLKGAVDRWAADVLPGSEEFIAENIRALHELRGPVGIASLAGLLWSARRMFAALSRGIDAVVGRDPGAAPFLSSIRGVVMAAAASLIMFLLLAVSTTAGIFGSFAVEGVPAKVLTSLSGFAFTFLMFAILYRLVPQLRLTWRDVLPGALLAAVLFELLQSLFLLFLGSVSRLEAIYGSLTSIVVLLLWLYLAGSVLLLGASLVGVRRDDFAA